MSRQKKPVEGKVIAKAEDKTWKEWYNNLTPEDHDKMLEKLGLDKEDREEFFEDADVGKVKINPKGKKGKKK